MLQNRKILIVLITLMSLATFFILFKKLYRVEEAKKIESISEVKTSIFVRPHSPSLGNPDAKVTLVEFFDPECESCREFYPHTKMLLEEFGEKLQLVLRYAPFHQNSVMVVKILEASKKQDKYFQVLEILFRTQPQWGSHHDPKPELIWNYLPESGVDIAKIQTDMNDPSIDRLIEEDIADGKELGVRGTPTFFVNGKQVEDFSPEGLKNAISAELNIN